MIDKKELETAVQTLELTDQAVCVHASLRSFGAHKINGKLLLDTLLAAGCTVMTPSFSGVYEQPPPAGQRLVRNGMTDEDIARLDANKTDAIYDPEKNLVSASMGMFPRILLEQPGRTRGAHPLNSFAALGYRAQALLAGQTGEQVYAPFEALCALNGKILLIGVGLQRATILHYAQQQAGLPLFTRWALDQTGAVVPVRVGGCSHGFGCFDTQVRSIRRTVQVGESLWQCFSANELVRLCTDMIRKHPDITRCTNLNCARCADIN